MPKKPDLSQPKAGLTFAAFIAVGVIVWALVSLISGQVWLGLAYGLVPGVALGLLGAIRVSRGGLIQRDHSADNSDREQA